MMTQFPTHDARATARVDRLREAAPVAATRVGVSGDDMEHDGIHQLVLTPLAERSWRLCDRAVSRTEAASVVAYVEMLDDGMYEAVWVSVGLGSARFPALADLFRAAVAK